jgi:hypothetical protein
MDREKLLSMDSYILLSIVNMKLRDEFHSLEDLCRNYDLKMEELENKLKDIEYTFNNETNQFV